MSPTRFLPALLAASLTAMLLTGCVAAADASGASGSTDPDAPGTCVPDPQAVVTSALPPAAAGPLDDATVADLDAAIREAMPQQTAAGIVVAVQSPRGTWTGAYGESDPAAGTPMTVDVHHRVGSITKTFTGTIVLQLAERGMLSLDDTISQYVDGVTYGDRITLRMLLDMTSGISSYSLDPTFQQDLFSETQRVWTPDETIAIGLALPPRFEPGAQFDYSNTNFELLGTVIEQVTGRPFDEVLNAEVVAPLGLTSTGMMPSTGGALPDPTSRGVTLQGTADGDLTPVDATDWNPSWAWTAGQMSSTAADLLVYGRAFGTGQGLLSERSQIDRLTSMAPAGGYGFAGGCLGGWFGHTGELPGFNTNLYYDTTSDTTVVVLANSDIPSGDCSDSKTTLSDPSIPCMDPATRVFVAVSTALGHAFTPVPIS